MSEKPESYDELLKLRQEVEKEIAELEKEIYGYSLLSLQPPSLERN